jgi:Nuclease-related domain/GYF domain 2
LAVRSLSKRQRDLVEDELDNLRSGERGEKEAAYHIDFQLKDAKNYAIIHDLRLEHNGRVAQIDHLIIGRYLDFIVVESKNFSTSIRMASNGEFEVKTRYGWKGMASPVEQNKRHIKVLDELIRAHSLTPQRLGMKIRCGYHNWVLVPPGCTVSKAAPDATILKMDLFDKNMEEWIEQTSELNLKNVIHTAKMVSQETLWGFAERLVSYHRPILPDYAAKFGVDLERPDPAPARTKPAAEVTSSPCADCGASLDQKVVAFCQSNEKRFGGRLLCRTCQQRQTTSTTTAANARTCDCCGVLVDAKVVAFCRFNSARFQKRTLCRSCQGGGGEFKPEAQPAVHTTTVFLYISEAVTGPVDTSQLPAMIASGTIEPGTPCCAAGTDDWRMAGDFV